MTPQQKANELVERFWNIKTCNADNITNNAAVLCAIMCVKEMIKVSLPACEYGENHDYPKGTEFLESVLNELKSRL